MSPDIRVLIRDCEDDPLLIWDTLKTSFIQQRTAPRFNAYHDLLSVETKHSELLEELINRINEQIRVIKSLSLTSFTLDNLYDELAVMAIIRALPHSFDDVVRTISALQVSSILFFQPKPKAEGGLSEEFDSFLFGPSRLCKCNATMLTNTPRLLSSSLIMPPPTFSWLFVYIFVLSQLCFPFYTP